MYARLCSTTGWTWEYVGQCMTLPRLYAFLDYWREAPPVAESVAAYLGIKLAPKVGSAENVRAMSEFRSKQEVRVMKRPL